MKSQQLRKLAPELDSLRLGSGWKIDELSKPQIIVESSYGHSHPGSAHLDKLVDEAGIGIKEKGGRAANYFVTDICDGEAQGHDGMNYSLVSRDIMAAMMENAAMTALQNYLTDSRHDGNSCKSDSFRRWCLYSQLRQIRPCAFDGDSPARYACYIHARWYNESRSQPTHVRTNRYL